MQVSHAVRPVEGVNLPTGQSWHAPPVVGWYLPASQSWQSDSVSWSVPDPPVVYLPFVHVVQPVLLAESWYLPASHTTQDVVVPAEAEYVPTGHAMHESPVVEWYLPAGHSLQSMAASFEVASLASLAGSHLPLGHTSHEVWGPTPLNFPPGQSLHASP